MSCDAIILGAGPYGIAAAAHLRAIPGLELRVFGEPMSFWERNMPAGMFLRSNWTATQIPDPTGSLTLEAFIAETGIPFSMPVPLDRFVQYGLWYQRHGVPELDSRKILRVERASAGFRITLADGEALESRRVIIAGGIAAFAWRPPEFDNIPAALASHTSAHQDLGRFSGKSVLVVGGGQSALESAALLHECGAQAEVISRAGTIHWLGGWASKALHHRMGKLTNRLLYAPTDVGPAGISQLMARPDLVRLLPRGLQTRLWKRSVRPAGARWLVERLKQVPIRLATSVLSAEESGGRVKVRLSNGQERSVDHVLLGTGYHVDVSKYEFLAPELSRAIQTVNGYPVLQPGLETSVPGLHILGAPAAWSFGPLMQFVSGTGYASRALARSLGGAHAAPADPARRKAALPESNDHSRAQAGVAAK